MMQQKSGSNSKNLQIAGDAHFGLSYEDARQVALDVFKANFYELSEVASKIANERAEKITEDFLKKFFEDDEVDKSKYQEPAVQYSIYEVQKSYARTGDENLEQLLTDALLARVKSKERSINQIVLDESISTLPKLTENEINLLSLHVSAFEVIYSEINNVDGFNRFINEALLRFFPDSMSTAEFTHLQYCGCFSLPMGGNAYYLSISEYFGKRFKGLFMHGFSEVDFMRETNGMEMSSLGRLITRNLRNTELYQFNILHDNEFFQEIAKIESGINVDILKALWNKTAMKKEEIERLLIEINPRCKSLINVWNKTVFPAMQLTSVGKAIAVFNINKALSSKLDYFAFF